MAWIGGIFLWLIGLVILYAIIYFAVKDAIDKSVVGQLLIEKYGVKKEVVPLSDEDIEKELEEQFKE